MNYAFLLGVLGGAQVMLGAQLPTVVAWWVSWSGICFLVVAAGYAGVGARVLGKRADGALAPWTLALLPFLLFTWLVWHLQRRLTREPCCHKVAPGIWLGRRPLAHEVPAGVTLVVDLTAEFPSTRAVRAGRRYLCLPTLDTRAPDPDRLRRIVATAATWKGGVYIHCANGHGRSATVAIAVLVARGLAADLAEAEAQIRSTRAGISLSPAQRAMLEHFVYAHQ